MPKTTDRAEELPQPFLRQRRNLLLTSLLLIYVSLFVETITAVELAPFKVTHKWQNGNNMLVVLGAGLFLIIYFVWRALQRIDIVLPWITPENEDLLFKNLYDSGARAHSMNNTFSHKFKLVKISNGRYVFEFDERWKNGNAFSAITFSKNFAENLANKFNITSNSIEELKVFSSYFTEHPSNTDLFSPEQYPPDKGPSRSIEIDKNVFKLLPTPNRWKQFWKYPYLSDYFLPFGIAGIAFISTGVRLIHELLPSPMEGVWF